MASYHFVGLWLIFMLLIAHGSGESSDEGSGEVSDEGLGEGSGLAEDFPPEWETSRLDLPFICSSWPTFPFFKDPVPLPSDADEHPFLKLTVTRKNSSDLYPLRIFIWPNTGNCNTSGQLTNGVMRLKATFVVETAQYKDGLCMTATQEVWPMGNQSVWTLDRSRLEINKSVTYDRILEGNGTVAEWHRATWLVIGSYLAFCTLFFLIWYLLVFPGTCL